jgi:hypothetical protein
MLFFKQEQKILGFTSINILFTAIKAGPALWLNA